MLIVEDSADDAELVIDALRGADNLRWKIVDGSAAFWQAQVSDWDVILCDYALPGFNAFHILNAMTEQGLTTPLIIVSGYLPPSAQGPLVALGARAFVLKRDLSTLAAVVKGVVADA